MVFVVLMLAMMISSILLMSISMAKTENQIQDYSLSEIKQMNDALPVKTYNGFQILFHGSLVNGYNNIVTDMRNYGFLVLKIMIALQLISDVTIIFI